MPEFKGEAQFQTAGSEYLAVEAELDAKAAQVTTTLRGPSVVSALQLAVRQLEDRVFVGFCKADLKVEKQRVAEAVAILRKLESAAQAL